MSARTYTLSLPYGEVPVTVTERGDGAPVLLLHGGAGPDSFTGFADELAARCRTTEAERAGEIAVVAHGGTLRVLNAYLRGIPVERMRWEPLSNGCILRSPADWPHRVASSDPDEPDPDEPSPGEPSPGERE